jgi:antitoxin component of MazEF toxin-antitoxin module
MRKVLARLKRDQQLARMVAAITPENRHEAAEWGAAVGREQL